VTSASAGAPPVRGPSWHAEGVVAPRSARALVPVLIFIGTVVAVISSLGAPLVPAIAARTGASLPAAQWSLTATLLVGAVATPVVGRLGDGPHRRPVVLIVLGLVTVGGALAALPLGLEWLVAGRGLQGFGLGLTPIAIATARHALTGARSRSTVAALSVTVVAGVGLGYPTAGLIAELGGVHAAFWTGAAISLLALVAAAAVLPGSPDAPARRLDLVGAVLLGGGLAGLLLALGQAETWGLRSPVLWILAGAAVVVLVGWLRWESRTPSPLVDLRLARGRLAGTAHVAALLVGLGNYLLLAAIPILAQAPAAPGAGFGTSIVVAGLILLPFSLASVVAGRIARSFADRPGSRLVLPVAALVHGSAFVLFLVGRSQLWELFGLMAVAGFGVGAAFAAFPALIISAVPPHETGSAMSLNQVLRYVGFAVGSALSATVLAAATPAGASSPSSGGYGTIAWIGLVVCLTTAAVTWLIPRRPAVPERPAARPAADAVADGGR
jgi:MFS family permease